MKVLVILGLPLSGKTTHAKVLGEEDNIPVIETGTFVYKEVEQRGLNATPENIVKVAGECKSISDSFFTERAIEYAQENHKNSPCIFLSGVKALSELEFIREKVGDENVFMVSFHACVKTRHSRLLNQDRKESSTGGKGVEDLAMANDISRFNLRDSKELSYGLGKLIALADFVINTEDKHWPYHNFDTTLSNFREVVKAITS